MPIDLFDSPTWQAIRDTPDGDRLRRAEPEVLVDLDADPAGRRNLIDDPSHAEVAAQLRRELEAERWRTRDLWLEEDYQAGRTTLRPSAAKRA